MRTNVVGADGDLLAVGLVGNAVDLLEVVRVGDDLVAGEGVLRAESVSLRHRTSSLQKRNDVAPREAGRACCAGMRNAGRTL